MEERGGGEEVVEGGGSIKNGFEIDEERDGRLWQGFREKHH